MKEIHVKIKREYFSGVLSGNKKAEFRINDRNYKAGDLLFLNEIKDCGAYTGRFVKTLITDVCDVSSFCGSENMVMISIEVLDKHGN